MGVHIKPSTHGAFASFSSAKFREGVIIFSLASQMQSIQLTYVCTSAYIFRIFKELYPYRCVFTY